MRILPKESTLVIAGRRGRGGGVKLHIVGKKTSSSLNYYKRMT